MFVEMTHPESGGTAEFPEGAVDAWRARGWVPTAELQLAEESAESASEQPPSQADTKNVKPAERGETQE